VAVCQNFITSPVKPAKPTKPTTAPIQVPIALGFLPRRSDAADVNVLPNPFHSSLFLQGKDLESVSSYTIKDISGRILYGIENPEIKQNQILITDLTYLSKGIYFIQINTTYGTQVKKLIKE
jgi:hypothetical protein